MPVFDTFAARKRATENAGTADVYVYDQLPSFLRRQLVLIFEGSIGPGCGNSEWHQSPPNNNKAWDFIAKLMFREIESFERQSGRGSAFDMCVAYLTSASDIDGVLTLIEVCARMMERSLSRLQTYERNRFGITQDPQDGIAELNERFRLSGIGYSYNNEQLMRVDSEYVHAEVVIPALSLLQGEKFKNANDEFRLAHEHYRTGNYRDCNTAALRSMESVLKTICTEQNWVYDAGSTVERLLSIAREKGLFPAYLEGSFNQLVGALKAGLPKVRDKQGGHAGGPQDQPVPEYVSGYALHLAASNIVLLVQAFNALPLPPEGP